MMRERGKRVQHATRIRPRHLGAKPRGEAAPLLRVLDIMCGAHQPRAWREIRQPDVEPVSRRIVAFTNSARRTANRAEPDPFAALLSGAEPHDANSQRGHSHFFPYPGTQATKTVTVTLRLESGTKCECPRFSARLHFRIMIKVRPVLNRIDGARGTPLVRRRRPLARTRGSCVRLAARPVPRSEDGWRADR